MNLSSYPLLRLQIIRIISVTCKMSQKVLKIYGSSARSTVEYINFLSAQRYRSINFYCYNFHMTCKYFMVCEQILKNCEVIWFFCLSLSLCDMLQNTQQQVMAMFTSCVLYIYIYIYIYRKCARLK